MKTSAYLLVFVLILSVVTPVSRADVMVSNLTEDAFSTFPVGFWWAGNRFVTDNSASGFQLNSLTLGMAGAGSADGGFFVGLYSDAGGAPGSSLEVLLGTDNPASAGEYTYGSSGLSLAPNTSYWVVAGVGNGSGNYSWNVVDSLSHTGPWDIPSTDTHITSFNAGGANWNSLPNDGFPRQFSVSATAVPEPRALICCALGAGISILLGLAKRRKQA